MKRAWWMTVVVALIGCQFWVADADTGLEPEGLSNLSPSSWNEVAPGVFEYVDDEGNTFRQGFGDAAARYDLSLLTADLARMESEFSRMSASRHDAERLQEGISNLQFAIANLKQRIQLDVANEQKGGELNYGEAVQQAKKKTAAAPSMKYVGYANGNGLQVCGFLVHQLADFYGNAATLPGGGEGTAVSSIAYLGYPDGSGTNRTASFFVEARASGGTNGYASGTATLPLNSSTGEMKTLSRKAKTELTFSAQLSTFSYVSISNCSNGYQSFSKTASL